MKYSKIVYSFSFLLLTFCAYSQCPSGVSANAGPDQIYNGTPVVIGGAPSASGGNAPYTYNWLPNSGFAGGSNNTQSGPSVIPAASTIYTLTVTDNTGCISKDYVLVINFTATVSYIVPKKEIDDGYQVVQNSRVYFKFEEEYVPGTLNYKITDYNPTAVAVNVQAPLMGCALSNSLKNLGDNRYFINVGSCGLTTGKFYLVEITNDKSEKVYFKFLN